MKAEAQRIAIAEACGWKWFTGWYAGQPEDGAWRFLSKDGGSYSDGYRAGVPCRPDQMSLPSVCGDAIIPDYLNDLNAMHEAEKVLTFDQREIYFGFLLGLVPALEGVTRVDLYWQVSHASAAQRAEAFLRTLGKWTEA